MPRVFNVFRSKMFKSGMTFGFDRIQNIKKKIHFNTHGVETLTNSY